MEMTIEEKAKAYDKAIAKAKEQYNYPTMDSCHGLIEEIFPEFAENEDERIRKAVIASVETLSDSSLKVKMIAWLEKQGVQKEWNKEENDKISTIIAWVKDYPRLAKFNEESFVKAEKYADWLKSIREEYISHKQGEQKPAWSKEDEETLNYIIKCAETGCYIDKYHIKWLKSLRLKSQWKPSVAQLIALSIVSKGNAPDDIEAIVSLYNDLKKLTE